MRLFMGICASIILGVLIVSGYESLAGEAGKRNRDIFLFLISVFTFHGVGLVMVDVFLRAHGMSWSEAFGFRDRRLGRTIALALIVWVIMLPVAWSLMTLSYNFLNFFKVSTEQQQVVKAMQAAQSPLLMVFHGLAAVVIVPFAEEVFFRGILYPGIKQLGFHKVALWGTALFFAFMHMNAVTFLPLTVLAIMLTLLYETTNNLLSAIITHSLFNAANYLFLIFQRYQSGQL